MNKFFLIVLLISSSISFAQTFTDHNINSTKDADIDGFASMGNQLFFVADAGVANGGLFVSNGSANSHSEIKDPAGKSFTGVKLLGAYNGKMYFYGNNENYDGELWSTDGGSSGQLVKEINSQAFPNGLSKIGAAIVFKNKLFFNANDGLNGLELWVTDGTKAGTKMVKDINPSGDSYSVKFIEANGKLFFQANNGTDGLELWVTDGTEAGTKMVKNINPSGDGLKASRSMIVYKDKVWFSGENGTDGQELWYSDGTEAGTKMLMDLNTNGSGVYLVGDRLAVFQDELYFNGSDNTYGNELWKTDGTPSGTSMLKDLYAYSQSSSPADLIVFKGKLFFSANDPATVGRELFVSDGTEAGTELFKDILNPSSSEPTSMTILNGRLFFQADNENYTPELWRSDGTPQGTINESASDKILVSSYRFFTFNGSLYFYGQKEGEMPDLWQYTPPVNSVELMGPTAFTVFPNPANQEITLALNESLGESAIISIVDTRGVEVYRIENIPVQKSLQIQLPETLSNGIYFCRLSSSMASAQVRFVLSK